MTAAPALQVEHWFNTASPISLDELRGKVVIIEAFQMLCPGCVSHGLPQAARIAETFANDDIVVIGLHSVFEHHAAQGTRDALEAFLHEYRIPFPVAIDAPSSHGSIPRTMAAYRMQGTPTLILIDRLGRLRGQHFGRVPDMTIGAEIMALVQEGDRPNIADQPDSVQQSADCGPDGCVVGDPDQDIGGAR